MNKKVSASAAGNSLSEGSNPEFKGKRVVGFLLPETAGSAAFVLELCFSPHGSGSAGAGPGVDHVGGPWS